MLRTSMVSLLLLVCGWAAAAWLTHGFQVWTDEGARRLEVAQYPTPIPPIVVEGPGLAPAPLHELLDPDGRVTVADFIYTSCQDVCLALGAQFHLMQKDLQQQAGEAGNDGVRLLSISFDGDTDTPDALARWGRDFDADPNWWQMVRVPDREQEQKLLRELGVVVIPDGRGDYEHNAALLVLDSRGRMVRIFDMQERQLALDYARHLARRASPQDRS